METFILPSTDGEEASSSMDHETRVLTLAASQLWTTGHDAIEQTLVMRSVRLEHLDF